MSKAHLKAVRVVFGRTVFAYALDLNLMTLEHVSSGLGGTSGDTAFYMLHTLTYLDTIPTSLCFRPEEPSTVNSGFRSTDYFKSALLHTMRHNFSQRTIPQQKLVIVVILLILLLLIRLPSLTIPHHTANPKMSVTHIVLFKFKSSASHEVINDVSVQSLYL